MNIFAVDPSPVISAQSLCDQHLNKMILEGAQLLSTTCHVHGLTFPGIYKPTHKNHPCRLWLDESILNAVWLMNHVIALDDERFYRFGAAKEPHSSVNVAMNAVETLDRKDSLPVVQQTPHPQCMPDYCKSKQFDVGYRHYYKQKARDWALIERPMTWTFRDKPEWMGNLGVQK